MKYGSGIQYGAIDPTYTPPEGQDILYENVTTGDLWHFDTNLLTWECITCSAATCPLPMTSAALQTHITNSTLMPGCDYTITDHTQGTLGTVSVTVRATTTNTVSHEAMVKTSFHTQAWRGLYDAQNQLLVELRDHQDNIVSGFSGTEIGAFDWGNGNITNCQVSNATLTVTPGFPFVLNGLRLTTGGTLNLTGKTVGALNNLTVEGNATVTFINSTATVTNTLFRSESVIDFSNSNGTIIVDECEFKNSTQFTVTNNNATSITLSRSIFSSCVGSLSAAATSAAITISDSTFIKGSLVKLSTSTGTLFIEHSHFTNSTIQNRFGAITLRNVKSMNDEFYTYLSNFNSLIMDGVITTKGYYGATNNSTAANTVNIAGLKAESAYIYAGGASSGAFDVYTSDISNSTIYKAGAQIFNISGGSIKDASIQSTNTSTGDVHFVSSSLTSASSIRQKGSGLLRITGTALANNGYIELNGARRFEFNRSFINTDARVHSNNLTAGWDILDQVEVSDKAIIIFNASGAAINGIRWSTIVGGPFFEAPTIQFLGTSSGQEIVFSTIDHSQMLIENCTTGTYSRIKLDNGSFLKARNNTALKGLMDINLSNSVLDVYDCTVAGDISKVYMRGVPSTSVITGTAASVSNVYSDGSTFGVTAGSLSYVQLSMGGVFNNGGLSQTNVIYNSPTNITCTVANTNATTITGVTSSNPVI